MSAARFRVQASGTTNTYVYCWLAARKALKQADAKQPGYLYFCMMAAVFAAFAVEAYLNHVGARRIPESSVDT